MISFKTLFKQRTVKFFVILFASILLLSNVALYGVSNYQYIREHERKFNAYQEMMVHLITMEDESIAMTYTEHYYHTQGIRISYYDESNNLLYETPDEPLINETYDLFDDQGNVIGRIVYDDQNSILGKELSYGLLILNGFSIILFLVFLRLLYWYLNNSYHLLEKDFEILGKKSKGFNFSDLESISGKMLELIESEKRIRAYQKEYVRILAHDIKTPLTVIKAYLEGIQLNKLEFNEAINEDMVQEVEQIEKMIPKFMTQNPDFTSTKQNIKPIIESINKRLKEVFKTKDIKVRQQLDDYETDISYLDISRIVENLLFNAFYYTYQGGSINIELNIARHTLMFKDTGIGMDHETIDLIKKGPYRSEKAFELHQKGSGMGLQIVFEIVERLGYEIDIYSEIGSGTEITIHFNQNIH
ncbi:MAG: HAMP domain-containing sensor histidine kinase [Tenericutes bacterium]|jgi:two-component system phosphate regulon sensor histidine kinase PhoR|nr:HAMP domain-containing sensor histidine kinase [Mycoplasmatota bacterium]